MRVYPSSRAAVSKLAPVDDPCIESGGAQDRAIMRAEARGCTPNAFGVCGCPKCRAAHSMSKPSPAPDFTPHSDAYQDGRDSRDAEIAELRARAEQAEARERQLAFGVRRAMGLIDRRSYLGANNTLRGALTRWAADGAEASRKAAADG